MRPGYRFCSWVWMYLLSLSVLTWGLELDELFEFGEEAGDLPLGPGSDQTADLGLNRSMFFFKENFGRVYINTNGFVAMSNPPPEDQFLGKMPASFKMIVALLGDLDNSDERGRVYFRQDGGPDALSRAAEHIRRAFSGDEGEEPTHAVIVTWVSMAARGTSGRGDGLDAKRNTFQLVVAYSETSSWAILLYPADGLRFLSTSIGGTIKALEAGFNEGSVASWFWNTRQGTYFRISTDDETSIRDLTKKTNSGRNGVWVYKIGASSSFTGITPGTVHSSPEDPSEPPVTVTPRQGEPQELDVTTSSEGPPTETSSKHQTSGPESEATTPGHTELQTEKPVSEAPDQSEPEYYETETVSPATTSPEGVQQQHHTDRTEPRRPVSDTLQPRNFIPEFGEPGQSPVDPVYHEPRYTNPDPVQPVPPYSHPQNPQIVVVDEDESLDVDVFAYNLETCALKKQKCSAFADCRDYSKGYCCHCRPGFYGNGKECVAEGKPQRMNGKVNGRVFVGNSLSPVELDGKDLHAYVVANDGRAYIAISSIPDSLGLSLQLLSSLGGVIGWAFALQQPGYHNGFSLVGGVFSQQAEMIFQPGNEHLTIKQQFNGIDEHDHLVVSTELEGRLPAIPQGHSVQISPYKEVYQYHRNVITSSSNRNYVIVSPDGDVQNRSYQWRQTLSFQSCPHHEGARPAVPTQQLSVDQIFVMFDRQNNLIRYAMSNKIGSVHSDGQEQNPCFTGHHGCDINAVCRPGEGLQFSCQCAAGFTQNGRDCLDVDECRDTPLICGPNALCSNQPGGFRCECSAGFLFASDGKTCVEENRPVDHCQRGSHTCDVPQRALCSYTGGSTYECSCLAGFEGDGRVCRDIDECQQDRCHRDAICSNTWGSFSCRCQPGFQGDGFHCSPESSERERTPCELHKESALSASAGSAFHPRPAVGLYIPQCDNHGAYEATQCHSSIGQCWCVDANGQEIPNTRTGPGSIPSCISQAVTPAPVGPTPRPDIHPVAPGTHLLFAQSGKIEHVPLDGYNIKKDKARPLLHIPDRVVIAVAYDCVERNVYWTDITGPAISKASLDGGDVIPVISTDLQSPEGIAIDHVARLVFWTDSMRDTIEVSKLDGTQRRVLFDTNLVNPRPIVTNPAYGRLYWADWNRDGPKIEMSNMDGTERSVLVRDDLGLPNGLTFDLDNQQLCWADAGTHRLECMDPHRKLRRRIVEGIQYPFALVSFGRNIYYTDWRREAVVAVDRHSDKETDDFQPQKRSRLYGITTTPTQCPRVYNYCSNNGGCSHLCLPRLGGFTCRCPDASDGACVEGNL